MMCLETKAAGLWQGCLLWELSRRNRVQDVGYCGRLPFPYCGALPALLRSALCFMFSCAASACHTVFNPVFKMVLDIPIHLRDGVVANRLQPGY